MSSVELKNVEASLELSVTVTCECGEDLEIVYITDDSLRTAAITVIVDPHKCARKEA